MNEFYKFLLLLQVFLFTSSKDLFKLRLSSEWFNEFITESEVSNNLLEAQLKQDFGYNEGDVERSSFTCIKINENETYLSENWLAISNAKLWSA